MECLGLNRTSTSCNFFSRNVKGGKKTVVRTEAEDDYMKAMLSRNNTIVAHVNS